MTNAWNKSINKPIDLPEWERKNWNLNTIKDDEFKCPNPKCNLELSLACVQNVCSIKKPFFRNLRNSDTHIQGCEFAIPVDKWGECDKTIDQNKKYDLESYKYFLSKKTNKKSLDNKKINSNILTKDNNNNSHNSIKGTGKSASSVKKHNKVENNGDVLPLENITYHAMLCNDFWNNLYIDRSQENKSINYLNFNKFSIILRENVAEHLSKYADVKNKIHGVEAIFIITKIIDKLKPKYSCYANIFFFEGKKFICDQSWSFNNKNK